MTKKCFTCKKVKITFEFSKHKSAKDGLYFECKKCKRLRARKKYWSDPEKAREKNRQDSRTPAGKHHKRVGTLQKYGITIYQYDKMFEDQNGVCAICSKPETNTYKGVVRRLSVDHNHKTGEIRSLLCGACNMAVGFLGDDSQLFERVRIYVEKYF